MKAKDIMSKLSNQEKSVSSQTNCINLDDDIFDIGNRDIALDQMIYVRDMQGELIGQIDGGLIAYLHTAAKRTLLNSILNNIEDAVIAIDADGRICFVNQAYSKILGIPIRKIIGKLMQAIEPAALILEILKNPQVTVKPRQYIESLQCYVSVRIIPIYENGHLESVVSIFTDATEIMLLNEEVERTKEVVAHLQQKADASEQIEKLGLIGKSPAFLNVISQAVVVAKTKANVLIRGENGVGKELIAKTIHQSSDRKDSQLITVNCAAIPESLIESELFGYEEGSFTGAKQGGKKGKFELASGGTLFLDEIGDMPLMMQSKLLRVLETSEIEKIGRQGSIPVDTRVIAATNQPLEQMIAQKQFRKDLYYRLNTVEINIPSLRERREDIGLLASHFLSIYNARYQKTLTLSKALMQFFSAHDWPGNIRELQNCIEYGVIMCQEGALTPDDLPKHLRGTVETQAVVLEAAVLYPDDLKESVRLFEKKCIEKALDACDGNKTAAMQQLGLSRRTFYRKLNELAISDKK